MATLAKIDWQPILEGGDGPPLLVFIATGLVIIAVWGLVQWRRVRIAEAEVTLKLRMVERGYSHEQIAQVVQTKMDKAKRKRRGEDEFLAAAPT